MNVDAVLTVGLTDIDRMGIAHNSVYPLWFETGRMKYLKKAGISNSRISSLGLFLPLSKLECEFKSPVRLNDEIIVTTNIIQISCVRVKFGYKIINRKNGVLLAIGKTVHAWTDRSIKPLNIEKAAPEIYRRLKQFTESAEGSEVGVEYEKGSTYRPGYDG
jgi:acyl-CoA thioester hydrolase